MKISATILSSIFFILILFVLTTYINFLQSEKVKEHTDTYSKSSLIIRQSNRFQRNITNMVSGLRGYLLTNELFFIQSYDSALQENESILNELSSAISENKKQQLLLREIHQLNEHWIDVFANPLIEYRKNSAVARTAVFNEIYQAKMVKGYEKQVLIDLQIKFREFINEEYDSRDVRKVILENSIDETKMVSLILTGFSIVAGIVIAIGLARHISFRVLKMADMANSIARGNYQVHTPVTGKDEISQLAGALNRMAKILDDQIALLKRKNEELDQFAYIVSHDMKAPLRGIDNVITWIEEDHSVDLPEKVKEYVGMIRGRIIRTENLLNGILSYSRVGKEELIPEVVHLNELINDIIESLPAKPGITVEVQQGLPILYTEKIPLIQVFTNLIVNAVRYHDKEAGWVKVYGTSSGNYYEFSIEDNGPGIDARYHKRIFKIFETLQDTTIEGSTGVGLAIVKKILDERNLSMKLTSASGQGSIFMFTWPKQKAE